MRVGVMRRASTPPAKLMQAFGVPVEMSQQDSFTKNRMSGWSCPKIPKRCANAVALLLADVRPTLGFEPALPVALGIRATCHHAPHPQLTLAFYLAVPRYLCPSFLRVVLERTVAYAAGLAQRTRMLIIQIQALVQSRCACASKKGGHRLVSTSERVRGAGHGLVATPPLQQCTWPPPRESERIKVRTSCASRWRSLKQRAIPTVRADDRTRKRVGRRAHRGLGALGVQTCRCLVKPRARSCEKSLRTSSSTWIPARRCRIRHRQPRHHYNALRAAFLFSARGFTGFVAHEANTKAPSGRCVLSQTQSP